jgi:hypothetical protein
MYKVEVPAPAPNPIAWAIAAALAAESELGWAAWVAQASSIRQCGRHDRWCCTVCYWLQYAPRPWDADVYRADCARRQVEPGPLPSLEWTGPDGLGWSVHAYGGRITISFRRGSFDLATWRADAEALVWHDTSVPLDVVARIVRLSIAAVARYSLTCAA